MARTVRSLIRMSAFVRKEVAEILRQPRLVITLILGPFLILLLFGLGYTAQPIPLRTLLVVPENSILRSYLEDHIGTFVKQLIYEGMTTDEDLAKAELRSGQIDVVVVVPEKVYETIRGGQQAVFTIYHDEIDPIRVRYATSFADVLVNQVNQSILRLFAEESQQEASALQPSVKATRQSMNSLRQAIKSSDPQATQQSLDELDRNVTELESALLASSLLLGRLKEMGWLDSSGTQQRTGEALAQLRSHIRSLKEWDRRIVPGQESDQTLNEMDRDLTLLDTALTEFGTIEPRVLVTPFRGETKTVLAEDITLVDYYVPAVIAVLLQHICVTFGALSIVRERRSGTMELFQVSPLSAFEELAGKYLSYLLITVVLTAVITVLLKLTLRIPMPRNWTHYAVAVLALLFTSLGLGFVLSLLARTTSQAVQYSMLALLVSVFFTGFFLSLELLRPSVRIISWAIPATYAIQLLQDIMLRGRPFNLMWVGIMVAIGAGLFLAAWLLLRRAMARM